MKGVLLSLLALTGACLLIFATAQARPQMNIPFFSDDTYVSGPSAALLASYISKVVNIEQRYPFDLVLDFHFVYTAGPEAFYKANKVFNTSVETTGVAPPPALIGPEYSSPVQLISSVGDVYEIPIMAFWATSPYLSSKDEYPNVWRAVSSDAIRIGAWVQMCLDHQWSHAIVIEEASLYGRGAAELFEIRAAEKGIKVWRIKLGSFPDYTSAMNEIKALGVKIILAPLTNTLIGIMQRAKELKIIGKGTGFVWLIGDAVSDIIPTFDDAYLGSLTVMEPNQALLAEFNKSEHADLFDVAYQQVEEAYKRVDVNNPFRVGTPARVPLESAKSYIWTAGTLPSALVRCVLSLCEAASIFYRQTNTLPNALQMSRQLYNFSQVILGENVTYAPNQEVTDTTIGMVNMRADNPLHVVGTWSPDKGLRLNPNEKIVWPDGTTKIPDDGIALENFHHHDSGLSISFILISIILGIAFLATLVVTIKFFNTPVFRLASPYSLLLILIGLFILTLGAIFYLGRPSKYLCQLRIWAYYIGLTIAYSALVAKTWRVWMVFRESNSLKKGIIITNARLMIYTGILTLPAFLFCILRTTLNEDYDQRVLSKDHTRVDVVCKSKNMYWAYLQQAYAALQMIAICFLAWKTRHVPTGFNEAKHVFISVYIVCTVGVIGLVTSAAMESTAPMTAIVFFISSMLIVSGVMWAVLFIPKLYIALFKPDLNTHDLMRQKEVQTDYDQLASANPSIMDMNQHARDSMQVPLMDLHSRPDST